jgi:Ran GTPase-activating protein (RanGAP) involved in mRNA processing and transport
MNNNLNINIKYLPDDIIRSFCDYLELQEIFKLERVSKRFHKVKKYVICIKFNNKKFSNEEFNILCKIIKGSSLQTLDLWNNNIGAKGIKALVEYLPSSLQTLDLSNNHTDAEGATALAGHLPSSLQTLNFSINYICAEGAKALAGHLPTSLQTLDLSFNNIGSEGAKALAGHLPSFLQTLDLSFNNIGVEEKKVLEKLAKEKNIDLSI